MRTTLGVKPVILPLAFADIEPSPKFSDGGGVVGTIDAARRDRPNKIMAAELRRARELRREARLDVVECQALTSELVRVSAENAKLSDCVGRLAFLGASRRLVRLLVNAVFERRERGRDAVCFVSEAVDAVRKSVVLRCEILAWLR